MGRCNVCGENSILISSYPGVCLDCIRNDFNKAFPYIRSAHQKTREDFNLPTEPPHNPGGVKCGFCINQCMVGLGKDGFCGLRDGRLSGASVNEANLSYYYDDLPTNCVANWVCPGRTEYGYKNLAVFYNGCNFNCLFCQNWHYRDLLKTTKRVSVKELEFAVDRYTKCICYFGGDPTCQLPHAIKTSQVILKNKPIRICWETNGSMNKIFLREMANLSLRSGGCIKFDLKAYTKELNIALCGVSNEYTLENFSRLAEFIKYREEPPLLIASTLLVPGYIDRYEVERIAEFIASLNPQIPYSLLAFYPCFYMHDLPTTSRRHAEECLEAAKSKGLRNVRIGNLHLLRNKDYESI